MFLLFFVFFFFFSSRRRHTRSLCDWSSDVCSSDLFASMTAVTGLEQAMVDSLQALFPGSTRDHAGNVTLTLGQGSPKRLFTCPLDEVGYVVGNILPDGFLLLRRVGGGGAGRTASPL